jgi:hypothetical protein
MSLNYLKREQCNISRKLILDSDSEEEQYLMVTSMHSDLYSNHKHKVYTELAESDEKFDQQRSHAKLLSVLVTGWNVPEEFGKCTPKNVEKLLYEYPQIADGVDVFATNSKNFLEKKSKR